MKQTRFISVVIATILLLCSADVFAQRYHGNRGSSGSGGRSVCKSSHSSRSSGSKSRSKCSYGKEYFDRGSCSAYEYNYNNRLIKSIATRPASKSIINNGYTPAIYFSKRDVLNSSCPNYGYEVSRRRATKGSVLVHHSTGDLYYRDGIFFSKCPDSRKYAIHKPSCGLHVPVLPDSSSMYELNGTAYYYYYATYYTFDESTLDFVVVTPPVGLVVDKVPCDAKEVIVDEDHYYIVGNVLYKEVDSKYEVATLDKEALNQIKDFLASNK